MTPIRIKTVLLLCFFLLTTFMTYSQDIDNDNMVLFMKANVLYESGRYDEAVRMYNRILSADDNYVNAYLMRAKTKYALAAYKGTKMDIMQYIERAGVNKNVLIIMAETEYKLRNLAAAGNYVQSLIEMDPFEGEYYYMSGMIALDDNLKNEACEHFAVASSLGHEQSAQMFNISCSGYSVRKKKDIVEDEGEVASAVDSVVTAETLDIPPLERELPDIEVVNESPVDLTAVQEIRIDDKLNLVITNGLGERYVESKPNIFMISSETGHVTIDICINNEGRVVEAEFNRDRSSIALPSMTSLAIRKAREFIFMPSLKASQCGSMIFNIKA